MQFSAQTSPHYAPLLGDEQLATLLAPAADVRAMIKVEIALAKAQSALGVIPAQVGDDMQAALVDVEISDAALSAGALSAGVPVPALVAELRKALPPELAQWLHWGATSQDIVDTATTLQIRQCLDVLQTRLTELLDNLQRQSSEHASTVMAGRTRTQLATPITLGLRIAQWAQPLIELENELTQLRSRVLRVQFGGAVGANTAVAPHGPAIAQHMAEQLGLADAPPWHGNRLPVQTLAAWLLQINTALGKVGKDLMIQSRSEIAELRAGSAGGSSTMPQKANPVQSEILISMNTVAQALHSGISAAASPAEERDGASWTVEWILLPQLLLSTACALRHGVALAQTLAPNHARMRDIVESNSQLMAEAASFALAAHMPRAEAQTLVKEAALSGKPLAEALASLSDLDIDWGSTLHTDQVVQPCNQVREAIFSARQS